MLGVATPGIKSACYSEPCDANDRVEDEIVASAKAWIRKRPACLCRVMQQEQNRTAFVEDEEEACGGVHAQKTKWLGYTRYNAEWEDVLSSECVEKKAVFQ